MPLFKPGFPTQLAITVLCETSFTLYGYDQGLLGGLVTQNTFLKQFNHPNDTLIGIITAVYNLGCVLGCLAAVIFGERFGRKKMLWSGFGIITIGAAIQCTAFTRAHLIVARVITGTGTGLECATTPIFQAEHCNATNRGKLVSSEVLFVGVGICIAYFFDFGLSFVNSQVSFRLPIAFQGAFSIFVFILLFALPESPRWLMARGRVEEAIQVMERVRGQDRNHPSVKELYEGIAEAIRVESAHGEFSWMYVIRGKDNVQSMRRVFLGWLVQCFNQIGGINLVVYYISYVLRINVGLGETLALVLGGCVQICFVIGSIIPSLFLDRMGRRKTMMWGSAALSFCMLMITILLRVGGEKPSAAAVAFFFLYNLSFGASMNCVPWCYQAEIAPLNLRARSSAISISSNFLFNFAIVLISPVLTNRIGYATYIIFTLTNAAFIPIVYFMYPETSNKTLEEIDLIFAKDKGEYVRQEEAIQSGHPPKNEMDLEHVDKPSSQP